MVESGKISAAQAGMLMYLTVIPTAILTSPAVTFKVAKQDLWLSPILAWSGLITVFIALRLHRMFPGENILQACEHIIGKFLGKMVGLIFPLFYLYLNAIVVREYGEFVIGAMLVNTPLIVVLGSMVLVCAIVVRGGIEIVGRFAELFLPAFIMLFLLIIVPIIPDLNISNMLPVMGDGVMPSLAGAFPLQLWFSEFMTFSFILPFVSDQKKASKSITIALAAVILTLVVSNLATLLLLGGLTGNYAYPFLILARYINLAEFFTHLESLFMAIWVLGAFVKICAFFYVTALSAAQWMNLSDYKPIVYPLGFLLILVSLWAATNYQDMTRAISTSVNLSIFTVFVAIPLLLLGIACLKKAVHKNKTRR